MRKNLNSATDSALHEINKSIENMRVTTWDIKVLIWLKSIPRFTKNCTSSTSVAFSTINAINALHSTRETKRIAQRKAKIVEREVFFTSFLFFTLVSCFDLSQIFSPFCPGAVFEASLKVLAQILILPFHS